MKKKNILLVGGTGFIGYHIGSKLISLGYSIISISRRRPQTLRKLNKAKYIYCDFTKFSQLKKIKVKIDYLINLGGNVDHNDHKLTYDSHYLAVKNLVKFSKINKILRFIQIGTGLEYGKLKSPHKESVNLKRIRKDSYYGMSKYKSTDYLVNQFRKNSFPVVILRLYQVYGPKQDLNRFIPFVIEACKKNKTFSCTLCTQKRDFLYIDDLVKVLIKILFHKSNINGQIFNIGTGKNFLLKKIVNLIKSNCKGGKPLFGNIKMRKDESKIFYPDITKVKKFLNWRPKMNLKKGLIKTINSYEKI